MRILKTPIIFVLLLTFSIMLIAPASQVSAASLADVLPQLSSGSGNGLLNVLLGLLMGKLFGNINNESSGIAQILGSSTAPVNASASEVITTAHKYLGVPYVWGGSTVSGFDCSGYTQYVLKQNGISIPRTAAEQFTVGKPVAKTNLKVGDLVFFTTYKPGPSHVGFYIGDGKFIHASSGAKQVTISELAGEYYTSRYIGARRVIN